MNLIRSFHLSPAAVFLAIAGGLALFLARNDAKGILDSPWREVYVAAIAVIVTAALLIIFKNYEVVGISLGVCMILIMGNYFLINIRKIIEDIQEGNPFTIYVNFYDGLCWGLSCFIPFFICILLRTFSVGKWDTKEKRQQFENFFHLSAIAFFLYDAILFFACFIFKNPIQLFAPREFEWIPFGLFLSDQIAGNSVFYNIGIFSFFIPIGFFLSVYKSNLSIIKKLAISLGVCMLIEVAQLLLGTGTASTGDIILGVGGFVIGCILKRLIDQCRTFVTLSEEKTIFPDFFKMKEKGD